MGDFYMTLPSNSSTDVYPDNNPGHFYTKLPQTYFLSGYEVGLAEIQFPNTYSNVKDDLWIYYKHDYDVGMDHYILPAGLYDSSTTIIVNSIDFWKIKSIVIKQSLSITKRRGGQP